MEWIDLGTVGTEGSENGIILIDEEYDEANEVLEAYENDPKIEAIK